MKLVLALCILWLAYGCAMYPAKGQEGYLHLDPAEVRSKTTPIPRRMSLDAYYKRRAVAVHKRNLKIRTPVAPRSNKRIPEAPRGLPTPTAPQQSNFARILPFGPAAYGMGLRPSDRIDDSYRALEWKRLPGPEPISSGFSFPPSTGWVALTFGLLFMLACGSILVIPQYVAREKPAKHYPSEPTIGPQKSVRSATIIQFGSQRRRMA